MSDNRDDQNPPPGPPDLPGDSTDEYGDDEKTQLVDLDALQNQGSEPQFAPPPTMAPGEDESDDKTELFEVSGHNDPSDESVTSSAPNYESSASGGQSAGGGFGNKSSGGQMSSVDSGPVSSADRDGLSSANGPGNSVGVGGQVGSSGGGNNQLYIGGEDGGGGHDDEATQFLDVSEFASEPQAHFTPEQEAAGYDGSTQFVDINALQAGNEAGGGDSIEQDRELQRGYQFGPQDIHRGEITLVEAHNPLGKPVVLKRVWEGRPQEMSGPLRERIAELNELSHPNLLAMNGMFVSDSGMWVELQAPTGRRLSELIHENGTLPADAVLDWMKSVADVLDYVHSQQLAYAHLTPDAIWIEDDGTVHVEPFDMLKLEERGNLGMFGPPEMHQPADHRQLSPQTDIYSLAAVVAAAVSGLPLQPDNFEEVEDKKLIKKIRDALTEQPEQRPATAREFIDAATGGDGVDIKIVAGGVFAVLFLGVAVLATATGDGDDEVAPPPDPQAVASEEGDEAMAAGGDQPPPDDTPQQHEDQDDQDDLEVRGLPGDVFDDPRVTIDVSYRHNPPSHVETEASERQINQWRQEAMEAIENAEEASTDDKIDYYTGALELLTRVITSQPEPTEDDWKMWYDVYNEQMVRDELAGMLQSTEDALFEGRIGTAGRRFLRLKNLDPRMSADAFLEAHNAAAVVELQRQGADDEDDE